MTKDNNYDNIIHMGRYKFRDEVVEEVKALKIKQKLLDAKTNKLEKILEDIDMLYCKDVDYIYNISMNEYSFKVRD